MDVVAYIAVTLCVFLIGFWLYPYLKSKGFITPHVTSDVNQWLTMIDILSNRFIADETIKNKTKLINSIAKEVVEYVENVATTSSNEVKKQMAVEAVSKILEKMNIEVTDEDKIILDFAIEQAVKLLPPTYKN